MATITVTNLNDSGAGSLRQAIADAEAQAGADTIMFADTLAGGTITLQDALRFTQDELLIEGDIDGDGAFDITISGGGTSQLVNNYGSADTTINGVYFDQGYDNKNYSYVIFNDTNAALTISNSYIVNSDVTNQSGFGGTIVSLSDLTLTNVLIDQASAVAVNSSPTTTGILNVYGGTLTIDRVGVSGGGVGSFLGVTNYGDVSGGVLGIGQGETGDEGTGLRNIPTNGSLTIGVTGDRAANTIDVSGASGDQAVLGFGGGDTITGSNNSDLLFGGAGDDQFQTTGGSHKIYGDGGADEIVVNADSAGYSFIDTGDGLRILGYSQDHRVNGVETITFNDITLSAAAARAQSDELSTLVTNLNDSGDGSLRRAIFEASVLGGTRDVTFSEDLAGGTIRLSSVLDIDASTAVNIMGDLNGDRIADITISGDVDGNGVASFGDTRHFTIESGGYLSLDGVNLIGGADIALPLAGGGLTRASSIDNAGVLKLRDLSITDGTANAQDLATAGDASVIYNRTSGDLSLTDVVFYDNTSIGGSFITGTGDIDGGGATVGIFNDGGRVGATRFGVANSTATGGDGSNGQTTKGGDGGDANSILLNTGGSVSVYASGVAGNTLTAGAGGAGGFTFDGPIIIDLDDGDDGNAVDDAAYVGSPNPFVSPLAGVTGTNVDDTFTDSASKGIVLGFGGNDVFNGDQSLSRIYGGTGDDTLVVTGDRFVAEFFGGKGVDTVDLRGATVSAGPGYNFELAPYPNTPEFLRFFNGVSMRAAADIERIFGSDGADRLVAGDTAMTISGGAGDDYLGGGANRDTLRGDSGGDIVVRSPVPSPARRRTV